MPVTPSQSTEQPKASKKQGLSHSKTTNINYRSKQIAQQKLLQTKNLCPVINNDFNIMQTSTQLKTYHVTTLPGIVMFPISKSSLHIINAILVPFQSIHGQRSIEIKKGKRMFCKYKKHSLNTNQSVIRLLVCNSIAQWFSTFFVPPTLS